MDRLYGIRPDYCLALRLIGCQEFSRRNQEFVEEHFKEIFMEREMESEIERLEARVEELEAENEELKKAISKPWMGSARAAYLGEKDD